MNTDHSGVMVLAGLFVAAVLTPACWVDELLYTFQLSVCSHPMPDELSPGCAACTVRAGGAMPWAHGSEKNPVTAAAAHTDRS